MTKCNILVFLVILLLFCSCKEDKTGGEATGPNGTWKQMGYGHIIELNDTMIRVYDVSKQHCMLSQEAEILDFGKIKTCRRDTLVIQHGIDNWVFTRLEKLPEACEAVYEPNPDPLFNFHIFWSTIQEHYVSFDIKHIDWQHVYETYAPGISQQTTDLELFAIFQEMIALLDDGHTRMAVPDSIAGDLEKQSKGSPARYSKLDEFQLNKALAGLYVDSLHNYHAGMIRHGKIDENMGYIQINSMFMMADYNLPEDLELIPFYNQYWEIASSKKSEVHRQNEVNGVHSILESILQEWDGLTACIIDLRFNGGGKDGVAMAILSHFTETEKHVFTKKAREGKGYTNQQAISVVPASQHFPGNVYLLTSPQTASAAEILVLASLACSSIKRIGSKTEGIFSSTLDKKLPNGWEYELSNEVYQDLHGKNYEHMGIPPEFPLPYSTSRDSFFDQLTAGLKSKKDPAIEWALELEKQQGR